MNFFRRTSSRLLSVPACQQQQQSLLVSARATTAPISTSTSILTSASTNRSIGLRTFASAAISTKKTIRESFDESSSFHNYTTTRSKHSSTQIKRLFKQNPARRRIARKQKDAEENGSEESGVIPESTIQPMIMDPKFLPNGWNVPIGGSSGESDGTQLQEYPFKVARTKNKPNNAVGFLPVYSEHRKDGARITTRIKKVSGDRGLFLNELRATLQIPIPKNPREDTIRIRTGGTIEIKGNRVLEVKAWLAGLGF